MFPLLLADYVRARRISGRFRLRTSDLGPFSNKRTPILVAKAHNAPKPNAPKVAPVETCSMPSSLRRGIPAILLAEPARRHDSRSLRRTRRAAAVCRLDSAASAPWDRNETKRRLRHLSRGLRPRSDPNRPKRLFHGVPERPDDAPAPKTLVEIEVPPKKPDPFRYFADGAGHPLDPLTGRRGRRVQVERRTASQ